jgi:N-acetylglucosamine-6-sulfatase
MAAMDRAKQLPVSGRIYAALVLVAACLLAACGPSAVEGEVANAGDGAGSGTAASSEPAKRPNVIMILTDDLDAASISHMPNLKSLIIEQGTTFENAFVTDPLCCPSRATILRGQYAHNHEILSNEPPHGGFEKFRTLGHQNSTMATWLDAEGYRTIFVGKYMNGYEGTHVPPGWDEWYAVSGNYMSTDLNENGTINHYDPEQDYLTDVLADRAVDYVGRPGGGSPSFFVPHRPFFMWLGTTVPHAPADPAPRHEGAFPDARLPRPPSFDEEDVSDKPDWISDNPSLNPEQIARAEDLYRKRLESMLAVDEMVGRLVDALRESGELENTYLVFTSDNGFHLGQHRLTSGKWTAYEEDIRVPLIVRGPGVPEGRTLAHLVLNNDLAPTFADLGGAETPPFVDGRSLKPLLGDDPPSMEDWRQAFLVEALDESVDVPESVDDGELIPLLTGDTQPPEDQRRASPLDEAPLQNAGRPGLQAVRTQDHLYVEYETGESELYDLKQDPYQLDNTYEDAGLDSLWRFEGWLEALRGCEGEECRAAENVGP